MKTTERILITIIVIGAVFKLLHWEGGDFFTLIGVSLLALFYFIFSFALLNKIKKKDRTPPKSSNADDPTIDSGIISDLISASNTNNRSTLHTLGAIGTGMALSTIIIGVLFKIMIWPGAEQQIIMGLVGIGIALILSFVFVKTNPVPLFKNIIVRGVIIGSIGLIFSFISTKDILTWNYPDSPELVEAILESIEYPEDEELQEKARIERQKRQKKMDDYLNGTH